MSLNSKVAIVTGFETPIGRTVAGKLAEIGYLVAAQVPSYSEDIKGQNNITVFRADINDPGSVHDLVESCAEKLGEDITVLINAEKYMPCRSFMDSTAEDYNKAVSINVLGSMHAIHFSLPWMLKKNSGAIINISEISSFGDPNNAILGATMGGINGLTKLMAVDYSEMGISTNTITVSSSDDEMNFPAQQLKETSDDIADLCLYLISHCKITGQNIVFAGGKPVL